MPIEDVLLLAYLSVALKLQVLAHPGAGIDDINKCMWLPQELPRYVVSTWLTSERRCLHDGQVCFHHRLREGYNELRLVFICLLTFLSWLPQER